MRLRPHFLENGDGVKLLAIDSSSLCASVAICDGRRRLSEEFLNTTHTHSETLLSMVESSLLKADICVSDIDVFACTVGPGSFTGIRIGVSIIKGLAFSSGKPCVGVSTLEAMAYSLLPLKGIIVSVCDARRCGLYNAIFECDGKNMTRLTADSVELVSDILEKVKRIAAAKRTNVYFAGDGYDRIYTEALKISGRVKPTPELLKLQGSYSVAMAALDIYENSEDKKMFTDLTLAARYLRATQAERERLERLAVDR